LEANQNASVVGVTESYLSVRALEVGTGLGFAEVDDRERRRVAILGANVASELFGREQPLGARIQIMGIAFRVIGVLAPKGSAGYTSPDDMVLVPLSTHQGVLFGQDHLSSISVQLASEGDTAAVQERIEQLMRLRHRPRPDPDSAVMVRSQTEMLEPFGAITSTS